MQNMLSLSGFRDGGISTPFFRGKVLLTEDDGLTQLIYKKYLNQLGYQVKLVDTGQDAIDYSARLQYEAMLLDLGLPDIMGDEVVKIIRDREIVTKKHLPIIILTAHADERKLKMCCAKGADAAYLKPINLLRLSQILHSVNATNRDPSASD